MTHDPQHLTHSTCPHPGNDNSPSLRSTSCKPKNHRFSDLPEPLKLHQMAQNIL